MAFVAYLLIALAWTTFFLWWLWLCWSVLDLSFEWHDFAGVVLPLSLWAGYRIIYKRVEAALTDEERQGRHDQNRDHSRRYIRAKVRNQWRVNRWKSIYPRETEDEQEQEHSEPD